MNPIIALKQLMLKIRKPKDDIETFPVCLSCLVINGKIVERNIRELEWNSVPKSVKKEISRATAWEMMIRLDA